MERKPPDEDETDEKAICAARKAIEAEVLQALTEYVELTERQIQYLQVSDYQSAENLEEELERKNEQKQRAFGALLQHMKEHDC
jgi:hypothetical protein